MSNEMVALARTEGLSWAFPDRQTGQRDRRLRRALPRQ